MLIFSDVKQAAAASKGGAVVLDVAVAFGTPVGNFVLSRSANITPVRLKATMIKITREGPSNQLEK